MKYASLLSIMCLIVFAGCGKQEDTSPASMPETEAPASQEAAETTGQASSLTADELMAKAEESVKQMTKEIPEVDEVETLKEADEVVESMPDKTDVVTAPPETALYPGFMNQPTMGALSELATAVDWSNMSWDKISEVPYDNKQELLAWATPQINALKEQLTEVALTKGTTMMNNLGDSGWQGALKDAVTALEGVKNANPETWELARGALVSSWLALKAKAGDVLSE